MRGRWEDESVKSLFLIGLLFFWSGFAVVQSRPTVEVEQGRLRGFTEEGIHKFRGIPFAAPPVGELRWRAPQPADGWRGTRDAREFGNVCPQILRPGYSIEVLSDLPMDEDCLYLNVWTPKTEPEAPLPVMVWILPGSFLQGDGSMPRYDGTELAKQDVVAVTFNYRLGMLGQFAHPALSRSQPFEALGNYYMMDQIVVLEWVRDNIAAFGGDPNNVTIFGMSAGGVSVNYHMASPASAGLFHKAISQSSGIRVSLPRDLSKDTSGVPSLETEGQSIADKFGIDGSDPEILDALRAISWEEIIDFQRNNTLGVGGSLNPVVDGTIVVRGVGRTFSNGDQHKVPYMTGATSWEGSLLFWAQSADPVLGLFRMSREEADALYHESDDKILNNKLYWDLFFGSQRYLAQHHAKAGLPTYVYHFSRVLDEHQGDFYGAAHGAETRYAFNTLDSFGLIANENAIGNFGYKVNDSDRAYANMVSGYWVQFAKTGDPNGDGRPGWPTASAGNDVLLDFGQTEPVVRRDFRKERRDFYNAFFDDGRL